MFEFGKDLRKLFAQARQDDDLGWVELIGADLLRIEARQQSTNAGRVSCPRPFPAFLRAAALWREHARRTGAADSLARARDAARDAARQATGPDQTALAAMEAAHVAMIRFDLCGGVEGLEQAGRDMAALPPVRRAQAAAAAALSLILLILGVGVWQTLRLPVDAVPDITNVQIQINTAAPGYSPLESEQRITYPVETAMAGLPQLEYTRSLSRYGLSQVTVVFEEGTDIYWARQQVAERLQMARQDIPPGIEPEMGPIVSGLGEIFSYTVKATGEALNADGKPYTAEDLRTIQDWVIKPQLLKVKGVTEINTIGGFVREYQVAPDLVKLLAFKLTLDDLADALERNNANIGAGYIERNGEQWLIRSPGQLKSIAEIEELVVAKRDDAPVRVKDVAQVAIGKQLRTGAATAFSASRSSP